MFLLLLISIVIGTVSSHSSTSFQWNISSLGRECARVNPFDPQRHKQVYTVGVLAIRGFDDAYAGFNRTFNDYLTATAGQRFDPPIQFEMIPLNFISLFTSTESSAVDFIYVNPSAYSCIESQYGASSLVTQISRRKVGGNTYDLKEFGGVIAVRANNTEINNIQDLKGKIIAAASISGLGSGQMQFLEMINSGMSYLQDPKQLVFTSNQNTVVQGVLSGAFDVGFVRTDQIEGFRDAEGNPVTAQFKIIDTKPNLTIDGIPFPFNSSTPLFPEWNVAALNHVAADVSREVQSALLALSDHAAAASAMNNCLLIFNDTAYCESLSYPGYFLTAVTAASCDTTKTLARIAQEAISASKIAGFQTTLSYMQLRSMQEATGFISMNPETKIWQCIRSAELYDAITCPAGYSVKSKEQVYNGCSETGLPCLKGFQCVCHPCEKPYDLVCVNSAKIGGRCVSLGVLIPSILVPLFLCSAIVIHVYVEHKRKQSDSVWMVKPSEVHFDDPVRVIGRGTFGYVLLAEYRGTQVAVKRVIPPSRLPEKETEKISPFDISGSVADVGGKTRDSDVEASPGVISLHPNMRRRLGSLERGRSVTGSASYLTDRTWKKFHSRLKADFVEEMRHLAKLRHPCITTVMGAVISRFDEPMLIMEYMSHGSLFDVLRNESMNLKGDQIFDILQDIARGLRFLHSASPEVIHGDLKAKNVLIDSQLCAKVTDFGLSAKKYGASGTPYWMAPELLRRKSINTAESDIYSFGIVVYEIYSRKVPYEGEDHDKVISLICDPEVNKRPPVPQSCPPKMAKLMKDCLDANPSLRPSAEQLDLNLRVEQKVKERTCRLEALNGELAEANKKIAAASAMQLQHFACMSHEIRTPLNCIIGLSSLLVETELDPMQKDSMQMIVSSGNHLCAIVDDVLDYSKLESGNAEVFINEVNLQDTLSSVVHLIKTNKVTKSKNLLIRTLYDPNVCETVATDGRRLQQILFNLLGNAIKFSKENGVVELRVLIFSDDDMDTSDVLRFVVMDYGKGIDRKNFEKIFLPFLQASSGIENMEGGTVSTVLRGFCCCFGT